MAALSPIETARFWQRVNPAPDFHCWEWTGRSTAQGYGRHGVEMAHRVAYQLVMGAIPEGAILRHKCDNPRCVNPKHLVPGDPLQNAQDKVARGRHPIGASSSTSKLSEVQALDILRNPDGIRVRDLAARHSVSPSTVSLIRSGARWAHLAR